MQTIRLSKRCAHHAKSITVAALCVCIVFGNGREAMANDRDSPGTNSDVESELRLPVETTAKHVKVVRVVATQTPDVAAMGMRTQSGPTLPSGKLPQYQLGREQVAELSDADKRNANRRFIVALPGRVLLLETRLLIDGEPFAMARAERVDALVKAVKQGDDTPADNASSTRDNDSRQDEIGADREVVKSKSNVGVDQTESTERAAEKEVIDGADSVANENDVEQPTVSPFSPASGTEDFVRRYYATTGRQPSEDEINWLLTHRVDGPVLLLLDENFQRFRALERPAFHTLDRDLDGTVSNREIEIADESFRLCDEDRNEIIDYKELESMANRAPGRRRSGNGSVGKLISLVPTDATDLLSFSRWVTQSSNRAEEHAKAVSPNPMVDRFDTNGNGRMDPDETRAVSTSPPDVSLSIHFDRAKPTDSKLVLESVDDSLAEFVTETISRAGAISIRIKGTSDASRPDGSSVADAIVEFSAVQQGSGDQIAIGAVSDGYPLLPELDPNQDGRFTIRERRQLVDRIRRFDVNGDGNISLGEAMPTVRICFALGPHVHQELASIRTKTIVGERVNEVGPEWFQRMDRNKDNDVSAREFSGNEEQFEALDADQDQLISAKEANTFERGGGNSEASSNEEEASPGEETGANESHNPESNEPQE